MKPMSAVVSGSQSRNWIAFSRFLKFWREIFQVSQEDLAFRLNSSPRHMSRLENGISRPSEQIIHQIAHVLPLGRRDLNHLLLSAGYSITDAGEAEAREHRWLMKAMLMHLKAVDPCPAVVLDSSANIVMVNRGWVGFFSEILGADKLQQIVNFYDLIFGLAEELGLTDEYEDMLSLVLMSIQQRALFTDDAASKALVERLASYPSVPPDWQRRAADQDPQASFRIKIKMGDVSRYFMNVGTMACSLGPNAFVCEPYYSVMALYPEGDEPFDFPAAPADLNHPLLFY